MISLVVVTDGAQLKRLEKAIESARPVVSEVVVVYQGSDDETYQEIARLSDFSFMASTKGNADPDRNFAYGLVSGQWILALDDDEWIPPETQKFISRIVKSNVDVVWFNFKNLVDGVDIHEVLGDDPHPRLWRKVDGLLVWPMQAHTFPQINSPKQIFTKNQIVHDRGFDELVARHEKRTKQMDQPNIELEKNFIAAVKRILRKK